jgi:hypothetical protein
MAMLKNKTLVQERICSLISIAIVVSITAILFYSFIIMFKKANARVNDIVHAKVNINPY